MTGVQTCALPISMIDAAIIFLLPVLPYREKISESSFIVPTPAEKSTRITIDLISKIPTIILIINFTRCCRLYSSIAIFKYMIKVAVNLEKPTNPSIRFIANNMDKPANAKSAV